MSLIEVYGAMWHLYIKLLYNEKVRFSFVIVLHVLFSLFSFSPSLLSLLCVSSAILGVVTFCCAVWWKTSHFVMTTWRKQSIYCLIWMTFLAKFTFPQMHHMFSRYDPKFTFLFQCFDVLIDSKLSDNPFGLSFYFFWLVRYSLLLENYCNCFVSLIL